MKITNKIHALKIPFQIPVSPDKMLDRFVYCYIIFGKKIYLIDSGVAKAKDLIFNYIIQQGRLIKEIAAIYLTHAHPDHIGAAKLIQEETGCEIYIHENEINWIRNIDKQFEERPIPGFYNLVSGSAIAEKLIVGFNIFIEKDISFTIYHTPGHSDGSVSFYYNEEKALFSGDAIILPGELPIYTNVREYLNSVKKIKEIKNIEWLLSSWDEVRKKDEINGILEKSEGYIRMIHNKVTEIYKSGDEEKPIEFCKRVLNELNLPETLANQLLVQSFLAHLDYEFSC